MGKPITVCLLHGEKCPMMSLRYIPKNSQFQVKVCRLRAPCNQQFLTSVDELKAKGPCEKLAQCPYPSEPCKLAQNMDAKLPRKRWINCWTWHQTVKEEFSSV